MIGTRAQDVRLLFEMAPANLWRATFRRSHRGKGTNGMLFS